MSTHKQVVGNRVSLPYTALSGLTDTSYVRNTTAYDCTSNRPSDVIVEVTITPGVTTGNQQAIVFIQEALDDTNFRTGPYSGSTPTNEPNLKWLGTLPLIDDNVPQRGLFSILASLGYVPSKFYVVIRNDSGATFTSGTVYTAEITNMMV